jgi:multiple sugar transport system permease protein
LRIRRVSLGGWGFVAFPLAIIFVFTLLPTLVGAGLSFFEWSGGGIPHFIGWQNYREALGDRALWPALRNTLIFAFAFVPITTLAAFLFAGAMNARWFVGKTLFRTIFFLPTVVSIVSIGFIWRWVLEPSDAGLLNHMLDSVTRLAARLVGRSGPLVVDWPDWLGNSPWGLATIIAVSIWRGLGFAVVLYLAALGNVPRSQYDAAAVDGAGPWQALWYVTWPGVRPTTYFLLVTGMIGALQVFDIVLVMIGAIEQPWTDVLNLYLYREFRENRLGYAAMLGVIVLLLTVLVTTAQLAWLRSSQEASA